MLSPEYCEDRIADLTAKIIRYSKSEILHQQLFIEHAQRLIKSYKVELERSDLNASKLKRIRQIRGIPQE